LTLIGNNGTYTSSLSEAGRNARNVELQGWALTAGASIAGVQNTNSTHGVVVDFVLSGSYVAKFNVPVLVSRAAIDGGAFFFEYPTAGTTVELGRGDSVAYELGGLAELYSPLNVQRLEFKRAVIYEGDISAFSKTADGATTRVEGDTTTPEAIGSYQPNATIALWYVHVPQGVSFPPTQFADDTIIGPVDPQRGPASEEGFVLEIEPTKG
jgi:hypothetical protein